MIDPHTGLDLSIEVHNPTLKKQIDSESKPLGPPKGYDLGRYVSQNTNLKGQADLPQNVSSSNDNSNVSPLDIGLGKLNTIRAKNQPFHHEIGNFAVQLGAEIVGGAVEGFGILGELALGNVIAVDSENVLIDMGQGLKELARETNPIYLQNPDGFMLSSSENFWSNMVSVGSTLSMLIPTMTVSRGLSFLGKAAGKLSKGNRLLRALTPNLSKNQLYTLNGISQASISRHIENNMEASEIYKNALAQGLTEEQAMGAAKEVYVKNWAMLLQDIPQYLALGKVFNPISGKFVSQAGKTFKDKAISYGTQFLSEGFEEGYQFIIGEEAMYNAKLQAKQIDPTLFTDRFGEYTSKTDFWNSVVAGGFGGAIFQGIGSAVTSKLEKKNQAAKEEYAAKFVEHRGQVLSQMTENIKKADESGNELAAIDARKQANMVLTQNALLGDQYETHIEWLQALVGMSSEELAEVNTKYGLELSHEVANTIIPQMIKESEGMKQQFYKYINKYGKKQASILAFNRLQFDNTTARKQKAKESIPAAYEAIPNVDTLTPTGKELLDNIAAVEQINKLEAYQLMLAEISPVSKEKKEEKKAQIKKEAISKRKAVKSIEDNRTPQEKQSDAKVLDLDRKGDSNFMKYIKQKVSLDLINEQLETLEKEFAFGTSPKGQREFKKNETKNNIKTAESLDELNALEEEAKENGLFKNVEKDIVNSEQRLIKETKQKISKLSDKELENYKPLSEQEVSFVKNEKEVRKKENVETAEPIVKSQIEQTSEKGEQPEIKEFNNIGSSVDPWTAVPPNRNINESLWEWLESSTNVEGYTAVLSKHKDTEKYPNGIVVTFKDRKGEIVTDKDGNPITTFLYESLGKDENGNTIPVAGMYKIFREEVLKRLQTNEVVEVKVKGKSALELSKTDSIKENFITDVFGENPIFVYTGTNGEYLNLEGKEVEYDGVKTSNKKQAGLIFIEVRNNNNSPIPIKLNRQRISLEQAEFLYDLYSEVLTGKKPDSLISDDLITKLKNLGIPIELISDKNKPTYSEVIDFMVYESTATAKFPKDRLFTNYRKENETFTKVVFGNNNDNKGIVMTSENLQEVKEQFLDFIQTKRFNIKKNKLKNKDYFNFLNDNKLLNTDKKADNIFRPIEPKNKDYNGGMLFLDKESLGLKNYETVTMNGKPYTFSKGKFYDSNNKQVTEITKQQKLSINLEIKRGKAEKLEFVNDKGITKTYYKTSKGNYFNEKGQSVSKNNKKLIAKLKSVGSNIVTPNSKLPVNDETKKDEINANLETVSTSELFATDSNSTITELESQRKEVSRISKLPYVEEEINAKSNSEVNESSTSEAEKKALEAGKQTVIKFGKRKKC